MLTSQRLILRERDSADFSYPALPAPAPVSMLPVIPAAQTVPNFAVSMPIGDRFNVGLAVQAPYNFTSKYLPDDFARYDALTSELRSANVTFPDITPREGQTLEIWGVVTCSIKRIVA